MQELRGWVCGEDQVSDWLPAIGCFSAKTDRQPQRLSPGGGPAAKSYLSL